MQNNKLSHYRTFDTSKANNMKCAVMLNVYFFSPFRQNGLPRVYHNRANLLQNT